MLKSFISRQPFRPLTPSSYPSLHISPFVSIYHKNYSTESKLPFKKVGVIGLGLMGHGITQIAAQNGYQVVAVETQQSLIDKGIARINGSVSKLVSKQVEKGKLDKFAAEKVVKETLSRISTSTNLNELKDCDLVIEAVVENVDLKKDLYKNLGNLTKKETILASNTSSLPIKIMADASGRQSQTIGLHFFNPVQIMALVEIVKTDATSQSVLKVANDFVKSIGKTPVSCKDTPGFIVNRLLVPYMAQAMLMFDRNDASQEDIDTAMRLGAGYPMGPFQLADYVGLDTCLFILEGWKRDYPNEPTFVIPECLKQKVKEGKLGRKTGEGFFTWEGDKMK